MQTDNKIASFRSFFSNINFMFKWSWKSARRTWRYEIAGFVVRTLRPFAVLIPPKFILDELAGYGRRNVILKYILLYALVLMFFNLINLVLTYLAKVQAIKVSHKIDMEKQRKWLDMDYENLECGKIRDLAVRTFNKVDPLNFFNTYVLGFLQNLLQLAGFTYIISLLHPAIILILIITSVINVFASRQLNKIDYKYEPIYTRLNQRCNYIINVMTNFNNAKELRINGGVPWLIRKYRRETEGLIGERIIHLNSKHKWQFTTLIVDLVNTVIIYAYCSYLVVCGNITVGSFTVFLGAVTAFAGAFTALVGYFQKFIHMNRYVKDYKDFESVASHKGVERELISGDNPTSRKYDIEFVDVSFKYPNSNRFVLRHINLKIREGERLAVVGYNGAGKSTLIKLLCRIYEPTEGKIYIGGVDIATIKIADYREMFSVVFQDYSLFAMSIRENIILNREFDQMKLETSIKNSDLQDRLSQLNEGVETLLYRIFEYEGIVLSGGEEQKLACARAYYGDKPIVILDEPTASLDPVAESRLYNRFEQIIGKKTSIYISHRLASARFCDRIAVFIDGEIVESGTHQELIEKSGVYADMFAKQAQYYVPDISKLQG